MSLWVAAAVALAECFFLLKSRRNYEALPELPAGGEAAAEVTVVIPARNEEASIARAVRSFPGLRVIVVDDASGDATASAARRAGAEVIAAPRLEAGRMGKPNACLAGAALAQSKWLLFVDADTWYEPGFTSAMIAYAEGQRADIVTAFVKQEVVTGAEKLILPYAFALYFCGVSAAAVNSPRSGEALANGQCLLVCRSAYEKIGGHGAVLDSVIEDVALARIAKQQGLRVLVVRAETQGHVRMYDGFGAIRRGFEKNSFRFLRANPGTGAQVMMASIALTSYVPVLLLLLVGGQVAAAMAFAILPVLLLSPWYGGVLRAAGAPLAIYVFQGIALSAMLRTVTGMGTIWKDRRV